MIFQYQSDLLFLIDSWGRFYSLKEHIRDVIILKPGENFTFNIFDKDFYDSLLDDMVRAFIEYFTLPTANFEIKI